VAVRVVVVELLILIEFALEENNEEFLGGLDFILLQKTCLDHISQVLKLLLHFLVWKHQLLDVQVTLQNRPATL
jgi:hypothetical protein